MFPTHRTALALGLILSPLTCVGGFDQTLAAQEANSAQATAPAKQSQGKKYSGSDAFREGVALFRAQNMPAAAASLRNVVECEPENSSAWFYFALALHFNGELEDALTAHLKVVSFEDDRHSTALYNAACASALLGRTDDAFGYLERCFAAGFDNIALMRTDYDLVSLRSDARFARYVPEELVVGSPFAEKVEVLFRFYGETKGDEFGWSGRNAGDCNGDGINDILISAPFYSLREPGSKTAARSAAGRVYVFSGSTGEKLFTRTGQPGERLGISVEAAGDVNDDGFADIIVGADGTATSAGHAYAFSGENGELLLEFTEGNSRDQFGWKVAGLGDVNHDGHGDVIVSAPAPWSKDGAPGRVFIYSGRNGRQLALLRGDRAGDQFGSSVGGIVFEKQAYIAVGASSAGPERRGQAYVFRFDGQELSRIATFDADLTGLQLAGMFISMVGDVDGDGAPDVYTSDWQNQSRGRNTGRAYVFSSTTGKTLLTLTGEHRGDSFGVGPGTAGDVNGDGIADLIVGAWQNRDGGTNAGKCYIFSGKTGEPLREITCNQPGDAFGYDATGMGDLDGDGYIDFLITSAWSNCKGKKSGRAFVIRGTPPIKPEELAASESK